ncbi:ComEA family DNA-binding protein [Curtobacterium sp. L1-20]|uniref:ComEA family DNA-binding protein n=1 Tax=Curtobacterium sp. L1-20 TaxID=3138181 RepID=UPI003B5204A7
MSLSPRAAVLLAAAVVAVAVLVVLLGAWSGGAGPVGRGGAGGDSLSVTSAPSVGPGASAGPSTDGTTGATSPADGASAPPSPVVVHVVGAVERPGVVSLGAGSRVAVAIERAGGAVPDADLTRLNLARVVVDGERLYVPRTGETDLPEVVDGPAGAGDGAGAPGGAAGSAGSAGAGGTPGVGGAAGGGDAGGSAAGAVGVVDLNTADQAALETLPGIGPALAGRILAWREEHGRFSAVEDLLDVSGIGGGRFADLRDRVRV